MNFFVPVPKQARPLNRIGSGFIFDTGKPAPGPTGPGPCHGQTVFRERNPEEVPQAPAPYVCCFWPLPFSLDQPVPYGPRESIHRQSRRFIAQPGSCRKRQAFCAGPDFHPRPALLRSSWTSLGDHQPSKSSKPGQSEIFRKVRVPNRPPVFSAFTDRNGCRVTIDRPRPRPVRDGHRGVEPPSVP